MSSDKHCCVPGCTSSGGKNQVLHGFPNPDKDIERFNTWLNAIGGTIVDLEKYNIYKYRRVCHSHFEPKYLCRNDRISNIAVPTLNMPAPVEQSTVSLAAKTPMTQMPNRTILRTYSAPVEKERVALSNRNPMLQNTDWLMPSTSTDLKFDNAPPPDKWKKGEPQQPSFRVTSQRSHSNFIPRKPKRIQETRLTLFPRKPKPSNVEPTEKEEELNYLEEVFPECPSPSHSDVPEPEPDPGPFSWQKTIPISVEKDELFSHDLDDKVNLIDGDKNKSNDLNPVTNISSKDNQNEDEGKYVSEKHSDFSCDHCLGEIIGYTCIQCENFDLCRACESRLVHPHHYVLRVPAPRPFNEIRSVIAAIRVKFKILEDSFRQQSDDWTDVVIKKEEDPLEEETSVPPAESVRDPLGESVVPNADPYNSQATEQESRLQTSSEAIQNINNLVRNSTSDVSGVSENVVVLQQDASHSDVIFLQQDADISNTESDVVFIRDNDVIFLQKNTSSNTDVVFLQDTSDANVLQENNTDLTEVVVLQQNASATNNNVIFLEQHTSDPNIEILQDNILKNNEDPYKYTTVANTNDKVRQGSDVSNTSEMFEEYLDEMWLDGSVLAKGNIKENVPETTNVINEHERGRRKRKIK